MLTCCINCSLLTSIKCEWLWRVNTEHIQYRKSPSVLPVPSSELIKDFSVIWYSNCDIHWTFTVGWERFNIKTEKSYTLKHETGGFPQLWKWKLRTLGGTSWTSKISLLHNIKIRFTETSCWDLQGGRIKANEMCRLRRWNRAETKSTPLECTAHHSVVCLLSCASLCSLSYPTVHYGSLSSYSKFHLTLQCLSYTTVHCTSLCIVCPVLQYTAPKSVMFVLSYRTLRRILYCLSYSTVHCTSLCSVCHIPHTTHSVGSGLSYSTLHRNQQYLLSYSTLHLTL